MQAILNGSKFLQQFFAAKNKGFSIVEILVTIAILTIALFGLMNLVIFSLQLSISIKETKEADFLAREMIEIARNFRDGTAWHVDGLGTLTSGVAYYPLKDMSTSPPQWALVQGEETVNQFTRRIIFYDVERDSNDNIVESGGVNDPNSKKIKAIVSWQGKEVEIATYLTNWRQ